MDSEELQKPADPTQDSPETPAPEQHYEPRPAGQVWAARFGLVVVILFVIYQLISIARGGL